MTTAIILSIGLCAYYLYVGVIYNFVKSGSIYNTPNKEVFELRTKYNVNIKTYRKERHSGFYWWNTVYLNEKLFYMKHGKNKELKALQWTFHHEYYHMKHHAKKVFVLRLAMGLSPMLIILDFWLFLAALFVIGLINTYLVDNKFEQQANDYADKMIEDGKSEK